MPASPIERRVGLAAVASLVLAVTPTRALAAPPVEDASSEGEAATPEPEATQPETEPEAETKETELTPEPEVTEVEHRDVPSGGGVAGAIVDPDDPNATRAQSDLEGESLDDTTGVPDRLPPLQAAGWWTTFVAVALATSGGILAGVTEVRQDQAERLAYGFDLNSSRTTLYGPVASEYERLLDEGHTYQWVARGLIIAGGATLVASIGLFAADAAKRRKSARASARIRVTPGLGGFTLRF
jgi:hypothetical protein